MTAGVALVAMTIKFTEVKAQSGDITYTISGNMARLCPNNMDATANAECSAKGMVVSVFIIEMLGTMIFTSVICGVVHLNGAKETNGNAACIGGTLAAMVMLAAGTTGGCINPAVGVV